VIWHTTGSGKSLSMVFLVGLLRRLPELDNPLFLLEVDRNDLDNQLSDQFIAARQLVDEQAQSVDNLHSKPRRGVILTTIEKFDQREREHIPFSTRVRMSS
jgi:type I restriction enzyme R subunit